MQTPGVKQASDTWRRLGVALVGGALTGCGPTPETLGGSAVLGAVAYALARRGVGLRIGGGSARSYFLIVDADKSGTKRGVCILPRGAEEGEEVTLGDRQFAVHKRR